MHTERFALSLRGSARNPAPIAWMDGLRYGPFLVQLIVTRKWHLACGYCTEYDHTSEPIPFAMLAQRLGKLRQLRTWALSLMGGEPTLHPDLLQIVRTMREMGFRRRMMTTNGFLLTQALIAGLNTNGLTALNVSVDGVQPNLATIKVLATLRKKLVLLAQGAQFQVMVSGVIGSAPKDEVLDVLHFAKSYSFSPRVLLLHDAHGETGVSPEVLAVYAAVTRTLGSHGKEAHHDRDRLLQDRHAPFPCRAGARYPYVDEFGIVRWCAQTRNAFGKNLLDYTLEDLRAHFYTGKSCSDTCSVGCVRITQGVGHDDWLGHVRSGGTPRPRQTALVQEER